MTYRPPLHESESGQMVLKNVKLASFDAYLWQTMWNHAKNQWMGPNFQIQCASDESETRVESNFFTTFKAPEFSGRIQTELLPSSDFLS